jgi:predicted RNase H-like HicB family nuclease
MPEPTLQVTPEMERQAEQLAKKLHVVVEQTDDPGMPWMAHGVEVYTVSGGKSVEEAVTDCYTAMTTGIIMLLSKGEQLPQPKKIAELVVKASR